MRPSGSSRIVALGGSLRSASLSAAAMRKAMAFAAEAGCSTSMLDLRELALPIFAPDLAVDDYPPISQASIHRLLTSFRAANAMVWASPTYHGAMSGAFKNAIDFLELLARDERPYLQGRAVGLVTVSDDAPQAGMSSCVQELRAWLAPTRVMLDGPDFIPKLKINSPVAGICSSAQPSAPPLTQAGN